MRRRLFLLFSCLLPWTVSADTVDLSVTTGDTHVLGADGNSFMGFSVATGDFNGDGLVDMVMGAPYASPGGRSSAGKVFVQFGATTVTDSIDLSAVADVVVEGAIAGGHADAGTMSGPTGQGDGGIRHTQIDRPTERGISMHDVDDAGVQRCERRGEDQIVQAVAIEIARGDTIAK